MPLKSALLKAGVVGAPTAAQDEFVLPPPATGPIGITQVLSKLHPPRRLPHPPEPFEWWPNAAMPQNLSVPVCPSGRSGGWPPFAQEYVDLSFCARIAIGVLSNAEVVVAGLLGIRSPARSNSQPLTNTAPMASVAVTVLQRLRWGSTSKVVCGFNARNLRVPAPCGRRRFEALRRHWRDKALTESTGKAPPNRTFRTIPARQDPFG
jgi:hypothetical protein